MDCERPEAGKGLSKEGPWPQRLKWSAVLLVCCLKVVLNFGLARGVSLGDNPVVIIVDFRLGYKKLCTECIYNTGVESKDK